MAIPTTQSEISSATGLPMVRPVAISPRAATSVGIVTCHTRSPVRSELRETRIMPIAPKAAGTAAR